ncbi:hypothetical protein [Citrobacter youngae]|uniref:Uncharacterized protein n=2 Tax=Enterobacteriaceae TaxID=543 RepID=D4BG43_9ENTR|nr:hypothetical protein [Citrobacter youngae]EFE07330.1 hypothetical protein CIT292_09214 [Citrobacter youngae ATCC 29220]
MRKNPTNAFRESYLEAQKYKKEKNRKLGVKVFHALLKSFVFFAMVIYLTQSLVKIGTPIVLTEFLSENKTPFIILPIILVFFAGVIGVISSRKIKAIDYEPDSYSSLKIRISALQKAIDACREQQGRLHEDVTNYLDGDSRNELYETIYSSLKNEASGSLLCELEEKVKSNNTLIDVKDYFLDMQARLNQRASSLNTVSFINLFIGISIATIGISILLYFVFNTDYVNTDKTVLLIEMMSKLGVSFGIELLSFFFLNLYRKNLQEIKYIQNELTNIEAKKISLTMAHDLPTDLKFKIIKSISMTERNFILEKGQTTSDLETLKYEKMDIAALLKASPELIKALKH